MSTRSLGKRIRRSAWIRIFLAGGMVVVAALAYRLSFDSQASPKAAATPKQGTTDPPAATSAARRGPLKPLEVVWDKTFGGPKTDIAESIIALPDGGFAVAGYTWSDDPGGWDAWVLRLDRTGRMLWRKTFGGPKTYIAESIIALPDGGFAVAGRTRSKGAGDLDAWILRLDRTGRIFWDKTFGGPESDEASSIVALPDGGFAVAGYTESKGAGDEDAWVLRLGRASAK